MRLWRYMWTASSCLFNGRTSLFACWVTNPEKNGHFYSFDLPPVIPLAQIGAFPVLYTEKGELDKVRMSKNPLHLWMKHLGPQFIIFRSKYVVFINYSIRTKELRAFSGITTPPAVGLWLESKTSNIFTPLSSGQSAFKSMTSWFS